MENSVKRKTFKTAILILAIFVVMLGFPILTVTALKGDLGLAVILLLCLIVNPIFSIILGVFCGEIIRFYWFVPIVNAVVFLLSFFFVFSFEPLIFCYAGIYLLISAISMAVRHLVKG